MNSNNNAGKLAAGVADCWLHNIEVSHVLEASRNVPSGLTREQVISSTRDCMRTLALQAIASATLVFIFEQEQSDASIKADRDLVSFFEQFDEADRLLESDPLTTNDIFQLSMHDVRQPMSVLRKNENLITQSIIDGLNNSTATHAHISVLPGAPVRNRGFSNDDSIYNDAFESVRIEVNNESVSSMRLGVQRMIRELGIVSVDLTSSNAITAYLVAVCGLIAFGAYRQRTAAARVRYFRSFIAPTAFLSVVYVAYIALQWQLRVNQLGMFTSHAVDEMEATRWTPGNYWWIPTFIGSMIKGTLRFSNEMTMSLVSTGLLLIGLGIELISLKLVHDYTEQGEFDVEMEEAQLNIREIEQFMQRLRISNPPNAMQRLEEAQRSLESTRLDRLRLGVMQIDANHRNQDLNNRFLAGSLNRVDRERSLPVVMNPTQELRSEYLVMPQIQADVDAQSAAQLQNNDTGIRQRQPVREQQQIELVEYNRFDYLLQQRENDYGD